MELPYDQNFGIERKIAPSTVGRADDQSLELAEAEEKTRAAKVGNVFAVAVKESESLKARFYSAFSVAADKKSILPDLFVKVTHPGGTVYFNINSFAKRSGLTREEIVAAATTSNEALLQLIQNFSHEFQEREARVNAEVNKLMNKLTEEGVKLTPAEAARQRQIIEIADYLSTQIAEEQGEVTHTLKDKTLLVVNKQNREDFPTVSHISTLVGQGNFGRVHAMGLYDMGSVIKIADPSGPMEHIMNAYSSGMKPLNMFVRLIDSQFDLTLPIEEIIAELPADQKITEAEIRTALKQRPIDVDMFSGTEGGRRRAIVFTHVEAALISLMHKYQLSFAQNDLKNEYTILDKIYQRLGTVTGIQRKPKKMVYFTEGGKKQVAYAAPRYQGNLKNKMKSLSKEQKFAAAGQLLWGLEGLSRANVAHGDLKLENCLFNENEYVIADFGGAVDLDERSEWPEVGTARYRTEKDTIAYEALPTEEVQQRKDLAKKRDVYAMGILLSELIDQIPRNQFSSQGQYESWCDLRDSMLEQDWKKRIDAQTALTLFNAIFFPIPA